MTDQCGCLLLLRVLTQSLRQRTFYLEKRYEEEVYRLAHKASPPIIIKHRIRLFHGLYNKTGIHNNGVSPQLLFYSVVSRVPPAERTMIGSILIQVHDLSSYQAMNLGRVSGKFLDTLCLKRSSTGPKPMHLQSV